MDHPPYVLLADAPQPSSDSSGGSSALSSRNIRVYQQQTMERMTMRRRITILLRDHAITDFHKDPDQTKTIPRPVLQPSASSLTAASLLLHATAHASSTSQGRWTHSLPPPPPFSLHFSCKCPCVPDCKSVSNLISAAQTSAAQTPPQTSAAQTPPRAQNLQMPRAV
ncbi:uncharacterized protein ACWYII_040334 isoform 1-T2 [Salvelinus alpinus]